MRKMKPQPVAFMLWFLAVTGASYGQNVACSIPSSNQIEGPEFPMLSENYHATIAVSILNKNYSMMVEEHIDHDGRRASLLVHKGGKSESLIFSSETNEVFYITGHKCRVYTLGSHPYSFLLSSVKESDSGQRGVLETVMAVSNSPDSKPVYSGAGTVRDIPSDVWSACLFWQNPREMIQATYYFSKSGWITSSSNQQTLLRVDVQGGLNREHPSSERWHHIYDFISYLPYVDVDRSIFMTPPHVVCPDRISSKPAPRFASGFKYRAEIIDSRTPSILHYAFWYDEKYNMLREDTRTKQITLDNNNSTVKTTTEIRDFTTGIQYIMNSTGCSLKLVDTSEAEIDENVARFKYDDGTLVVDVRDHNSVFFSNGNYAYIGQRTIRGIQCDVFSAKVPKFALEGVKHDAVYEYAFLADGWGDLPLDGKETRVQRNPVQLVISIQSVNYSRVYNFFEFAEDFDTYPTFDVSKCFPNKIGFEITFPESGDEFPAAAIHTSLAEAMDVSAVRVGGISVRSDKNYAYVNAYVLPTTAIAQFKRLPGFVLEHETDQVIKGITSADDCAVLCNTDTNFLCQEFEYCENDGFSCGLNREHLAQHHILFNATACDIYERTATVATKTEPLLNEAYAALLNSVRHGNLSIEDNGQKVNAFDVQLTSGQFVGL